MIHIEVGKEEQDRLRYERYNHPDPRVQRKMDSVLLKSCGLSHKDICKIVGISTRTLPRYLHEYQKGGIQRLKQCNYRRPRSGLAQHNETLQEYFEQHPPSTIKEARAKIEELTGVKRSVSQVRRFMKQSLGLRRLKVAAIPAKADADKQKAFQRDELEPRLKLAAEGKRHVYFVDASHFVFAVFLGFVWTNVRRFIRAPSGRKRFNVLGALDAVTHELITITNTTYINAESVCQLLWRIAEKAGGIPVTLVLDNARYQRCKVVTALAVTLKFELLYLPPYSPNLNLIERFWKFVKKECLYSKYYSTFEDFKEAISECIAQSGTKHKDDLDSLLTHKFQTLEKATNLAA